MDDETHALLSYCTVGKFNSGSIFYQGNLATDINIINHSKVYLFILLILRKTSQKRYSYMDIHISVKRLKSSALYIVRSLGVLKIQTIFYARINYFT